MTLELKSPTFVGSKTEIEYMDMLMGIFRTIWES